MLTEWWGLFTSLELWNVRVHHFVTSHNNSKRRKCKVGESLSTFKTLSFHAVKLMGSAHELQRLCWICRSQADMRWMALSSLLYLCHRSHRATTRGDIWFSEEGLQMTHRVWYEWGQNSCCVVINHQTHANVAFASFMPEEIQNKQHVMHNN